jgi:hypothetical protein
MSKAFVMLTATRIQAGPISYVAGALQQETHLFDGDQCVCKLLVTFPAGSPQWEEYQRSRTLDGAPPMQPDTHAGPRYATADHPA